MNLIDKESLIAICEEQLKYYDYCEFMAYVNELPVINTQSFIDEIAFLKSYADKLEAQIAGLTLENNILRGEVNEES